MPRNQGAGRYSPLKPSEGIPKVWYQTLIRSLGHHQCRIRRIIQPSGKTLILFNAGSLCVCFYFYFKSYKIYIVKTERGKIMDCFKSDSIYPHRIRIRCFMVAGSGLFSLRSVLDRQPCFPESPTIPRTASIKY